jgi:LemA protein
MISGSAGRLAAVGLAAADSAAEVSAAGAGLAAADLVALAAVRAAEAAPPAGSDTIEGARRTMNMMKGLLAVVVVVLLLGAVNAGCSYNKFTTQEESAKAQWGQVENQLQRRNDLIPNLVETTKGFAQQEKDVFKAVADARAKMAGASTPSETIAAANAQSSALSRLLVVVENYPQLKSDQTFMRLMDELAGTENRIGTMRGDYNERVREYNQLRRRFPSNITAAIFGFKEYPYFDAPKDVETVPKVDFGKGK